MVVTVEVAMAVVKEVGTEAVGLEVVALAEEKVGGAEMAAVETEVGMVALWSWRRRRGWW